MNILTRRASSAVDISNGATVLSYTAPTTKLVIAQVSVSGFHADSYQIQLYVDDLIIVPDKSIPISSTSAIAQSRSLVLEAGSTLRVVLTGDHADVAVDCTVLLIDATPVITDDVVNRLIPSINAAIVDNMATLNVQPTVTVLAPIDRQLTQLPHVTPREVVEVPVDLRSPPQS